MPDSAEPNPIMANNAIPSLIVDLEHYVHLPAACTMCNNPRKWQCNTCHCSQYCSQQCQKDDWPVHKLLCKTFRDFNLSTRPSPNHIRALYLHPSAEYPTFVWLLEPGQDNGGNIVLEGGALPGNNETLEPVEKIVASVLLRRMLQPTLLVAASINQPTSGNKSLERINLELSRSFHGPILVMGCMEVNASCTAADLDMMDFRHLVDHMRVMDAFKKYRVETIGTENASGVTAVRVNCHGDRFLHPHRRKEFEKTIMRAAHLESAS